MRFRRKPKRCRYGSCGTRSLPAEDFCEVHLLKSNEGRYQCGYMSDWVELELELWPPGDS